MEIETTLQSIGLTSQEAKIFISTLKVGTAKASDIAEKSGVAREACYYTLKLLSEKGLISEVIKSGVKHYSAIQPKRIIDKIKEEQEEKISKVKEILSELESLQNITLEKPVIQHYEGLEGYKTIASMLLSEPNKEHIAYVPEAILKISPIFDIQFRRIRKEKNIRVRIITEKTSFMEEIRRKDKEELRKTRFNNILKGLDVGYYICGNKMLILKANKNEQSGISIEEKSSAELQRRIFENIWKKSE